MDELEFQKDILDDQDGFNSHGQYVDRYCNARVYIAGSLSVMHSACASYV